MVPMNTGCTMRPSILCPKGKSVPEVSRNWLYFIISSADLSFCSFPNHSYSRHVVVACYPPPQKKSPVLVCVWQYRLILLWLTILYWTLRPKCSHHLFLTPSVHHHPLISEAAVSLSSIFCWLKLTMALHRVYPWYPGDSLYSFPHPRV